MIAYFGVFLVAPLTGLAIGLLGLGVLLATLVALSGGGAVGSLWRAAGLVVVAAAAAVLRLARRVPPLLRLDAAHLRHLSAAVGPKARALAQLRVAGFAVLPGVVLVRPASRRALEAALARLGADRVIVRGSFEGARVPAERDVPATAEAVARAAATLRDAAGGAPGAVLVQPFVSDLLVDAVASVDPRTGCREHAVVQRSRLRADGSDEPVETHVLNRLLGQSHPALDALDALGLVDHEAQVAVDGGQVLGLGPLLGVPRVDTYVNGGWAAVPTAALSPESLDFYLQPQPGEAAVDAFKRRLREALEPIGLVAPDRVLFRDGRFYVAYAASAPPRSPWRWTLALLGASQRRGDPALCGARAASVAAAWRQLALRLGAAPESLRACEAGMEPSGRPAQPEELADPGYDTDWPAWAPPPPPALPERGVSRLALRLYRAALIRRTQAKERQLQLGRAQRGRLDPKPIAPPNTPAPALIHVGEGLIDVGEGLMDLPGAGGAWAPGAPGVATGPLLGLGAFLAEPGGAAPVLWLPDARPAHAVHLSRVAGLVVDRAGPLSHLILLAREAGVPTVLGPRPALAEGTLVRVDGALGRVDEVSP